jgi:hypothetical protein
VDVVPGLQLRCQLKGIIAHAIDGRREAGDDLDNFYHGIKQTKT